jgi:serine phosphatase RsbU (regulator of sigma subunit)
LLKEYHVIILASFGFIIVYLIYSLIRYVEKTNRDLMRFLQAFQYEDFSETFSDGHRGSSFRELSRAFNDVMKKIRRVRSDKEEQFHYLQTVVQHVGTGVIAFQQNGDVELINKATKQLLKLKQLRNIQQLESVNPDLVQTLFAMKPGERSLVDVIQDRNKMKLSIEAAQFRMRGNLFTLVSLQNIQNELERERMVKELEIARQVQMQLFPKESPKYTGFEISGLCLPAKEVGGDYYDFIDFGKKRLGIVVGDVSGKGVPAAIYMTLAKGVIQSHARESVTPPELLSKLNHVMYRTMEKNAFVSMFYAILNGNQMKLTCARAGHNPAIHYTKEKDTFTSIEPSGIALGLEKNSLFQNVIKEMEIYLKKGDIFIIYTDGFTEAMDSKKDEYSEERLMAVIRENRNKDVDTIIKRIHQDVNKFTQDHHQHDDMTMIVLKVL